MDRQEAIVVIDYIHMVTPVSALPANKQRRRQEGHGHD
jgi:hypothetical protein